MPNSTTTARTGRTYRATATVTPIQHVGSYDNCAAWCDGLLNREVYVIDADGRQRVVGIIQRTEYVNADGH